MLLRCPECRKALTLEKESLPTFRWSCGCGYSLDTGVSHPVHLDALAKVLRCDMELTHWGGYSILKEIDAVDAIRVYMPIHVTHFIDCTWGGCYNSCYMTSIKPFLNSIDVVEYITKTAVQPLRNTWRTRGGGLMYDDLFQRLANVDDPAVRGHILNNCCPGSGL